MRKFYVLDMSGYVLTTHKTIEAANESFLKLAKEFKGLNVEWLSTDFKNFKVGDYFSRQQVQQ